MKKYLQVKNPTAEVNAIRVDVYYNKGGFNCFTYKEEKRGYYASVMPVRRDGFMESYCCFTGAKQLIKEVNRKSEKAYNEAVNAAGEYIDALIEFVCKNSGVEVAQNESII